MRLQLPWPQLVLRRFSCSARKVWLAFADSTAFTRTVVLEAGDTGWAKIQSLFSAVRMWGGSVETAYAAQAGLALAVAATLVWLWRAPAAYELKAAALACACLLTTPYVLDYDLVVLAVAIAYFTRYGLARGFRDYEISLLAFVWVTPLVARSLASVGSVPLGHMAMLVLYALTLRQGGRRPRQRNAADPRALTQASAVTIRA